MGFCKEAIFCLSYYKEAPTEHARGKLYQWRFRRLVIRWGWTKCHSKSSRTWVRRSGKQAKQNHREVLQLVKEFKIWLFYQLCSQSLQMSLSICHDVHGRYISTECRKQSLPRRRRKSAKMTRQLTPEFLLKRWRWHQLTVRLSCEHNLGVSITR